MARSGDSVETPVERADWLMFGSKNAGGNQATFG